MNKLLAIAAMAMLMTGAAQADVPGFVSEGKLNVCTTAGFPPLTYKTNPGDTTPVGIDIDVVEALAKLWNAKAAYTVTDFAGLLPTLGSGRCGLIVSGIYINDKRRETYDGAPYMKSATVIVTKADNAAIKAPEDLSGKTIALEAGTYYREERVDPLNKDLMAKGVPPLTAQDYPSQQAAYQQVIVGRADATLTEEAEGAFRVAGASDQLRVAYVWQSEFKYGIYSRRDPADFAAVKLALKALREQGFFVGLAKKYGLDPAVFDVDYDL
ncbi:polar amino acid transport system substrate-binding protein [Aminobacter lissarensis]|uniref:Polar amino acid transport system substrate-binding protein n=1 Tax=Aminobacter carboxidus TaxID=376165 RepID=A0A8E1WJB7_9HYPH|nr:transporter substrate-binding domain-containing protein [Aminobacter lissarensis]MBB6470101.1 polar amino acid transport system substrate-binding protein [Aminobacter lissarensis]